MKPRLVLLPVLIIFLLTIGFSGSALAGKLQQQLVQESAVEQILKKGVLKVGMSLLFPGP